MHAKLRSSRVGFGQLLRWDPDKGNSFPLSEREILVESLCNDAFEMDRSQLRDQLTGANDELTPFGAGVRLRK